MRTIINKIEKIEIVLLVSILILEVLVSFLALITRLFIDNQFIQDFNQTILGAGLIWIGFLGGSIAISKNKSIAIDAVFQFLSTPLKKKLGNIIFKISALLSFMLALVAFAFFKAKIKSEIIENPGVDLFVYISVLSRVIYPLALFIYTLKFLFLNEENIESSF